MYSTHYVNLNLVKKFAITPRPSIIKTANDIILRSVKGTFAKWQVLLAIETTYFTLIRRQTSKKIKLPRQVLELLLVSSINVL